MSTDNKGCLKLSRARANNFPFGTSHVALRRGNAFFEIIIIYGEKIYIVNNILPRITTCNFLCSTVYVYDSVSADKPIVRISTL